MTTSEPGIDGRQDPASVRVTAFPSLPSTEGVRSPPLVPRIEVPPPSAPSLPASFGSYSYPGSSYTTTTDYPVRKVAPSVLYEDEVNRMFQRRRQQIQPQSKTSITKKPPRVLNYEGFTPKDVQTKTTANELSYDHQQPTQRRVTRRDESPSLTNDVPSVNTLNSIVTRRKSLVGEHRRNNKLSVQQPKTTTTTTTETPPSTTDSINDWKTIRSNIQVSLTPTPVEIPSGLVNEFRNHGITERESLLEMQRIRNDFLRKSYRDLPSLPLTRTSTTIRPTTSAPLIGGGIGTREADKERVSFSHGLLEVPAPLDHSQDDNVRKINLPSTSSLIPDSSNEESFSSLNNKLVFDENTFKPTTLSVGNVENAFSSVVSHPLSKKTTPIPWSAYFEPKRLVTRPISYQFSRSLVSLLPRRMSSSSSVVSSTTPESINRDSTSETGGFVEDDIPNKVTSTEEEESDLKETVTPAPLVVFGNRDNDDEETSSERRRVKEEELSSFQADDDRDAEFWKK
jgi:hypothetical protein